MAATAVLPIPPAAPLIGREHELAALSAALMAALAGQGSLALIAGEAGIGKTTLAEALCREAMSRGALVVVGRCYDLAETPPYGPWAELFACLPASPGQPPLPAPLGSGGAAENQGDLVAAALAALTGAAARRPLALLLDDLHWADPASLDLLRALGRQVAALPLLLLATYRADEVTPGHPLYQTLPALVREARAVRIALRPLDLPNVAALVAARYPLPEPDAGRLVAYLDRRAEGNPFFVGELLYALEESGLLRPPGAGEALWALGDLDRARLSSLVRQVIDGRAARLGEAARGLLAVAAAIGQEVPLRLWGAVAGADDAALLPAAEAALEARLLLPSDDAARLRFAHALVREALYESLPPLRRGTLHQRIGETLAAQPAPDPDAVAYHFRRAGDARAYDWLVRAGERAQGGWAWQSAAERYEAALALADTEQVDPVARGWLHYRLGAVRMYSDVGQGRAALTEALRLADVSGDHALWAYARGRLGWLRYATGDLRQGLADMEVGADALEAIPPEQLQRHPGWLPPDRQGLALLLSWVGRYAEARAIAESFLVRPARRHSDTYGALRDVHAALGNVRMTREMVGHFDEVLRRPGANPFVAGYSPFCDLIMVALPYAADDLAWRHHLAAQSEAGFARAGGMVSSQATRVARLPLLLLEGHWAEAREMGQAVRAVRAVGEAWWDRVTGPVLATIAHAQGEPQAAWALVRAYHPAGPATEPGGTYFHAGLALQRIAAALALDAGDLLPSREWLEAHDRWLAWSGAVLGQAEGALAWAIFHRAAGDYALARQLAEQALAHATEPRQPLALLAAHRLLSELGTEAGSYDDARQHLDAALALAAACAVPYERALTFLARAELRAATGDRDGARATLDEARAILAPLDARPALARADALAARLHSPGQPRATFPAGLTAREVEVLRLVAEGLPNTEVAARLFLSARTVEQHLRSIYNKLDVSSRTAAARFATEHKLL